MCEPRAARGGRPGVLSRCEGFRVESREGHLGFVDEVLLDPRSRAPVALVVRSGLFSTRRLLTPVETIEEVRPRDRRIVVGAEAVRRAASWGP